MLCSGCGQSRVLDTTGEHVTALPSLQAQQRDAVPKGNSYLHCGEPMTPPGPPEEAVVQTFPAQDPTVTVDSLAAYLATKVLRCHCGFQMEVPS